MDIKELDILKRLLNQEDYITYIELGNLLHLSTSTIRNRVDVIDQILAENGFSAIERKPRYGIRIHQEEIHKITKHFFSESEGIHLDFGRLEARYAFIVFVILTQQKVTLEKLSILTEMSKRTIQNDISVLKSRVNHNHCTLNANIEGYHIAGDSISVRTLIIDMIKDCVKTADERLVLTYLLEMYQLVFPDDALFEKTVIQFYEKLLDIIPDRYSKVSKIYIITYLTALVLSRYSGDYTPLLEDERDKLEKSTSSQLAKDLLDITQDVYDCILDPYEAYFLIIILHTLPISDISQVTSIYPIELELFSHQIIAGVSDSYQYPFYNDNELYEIIINHLIPLVKRLEFDTQIKNPLLESIVDKYETLHESVRDNVRTLEQHLKQKLEEDEIAFFTLYFASSIEKLEKTYNRNRVLIVCNSGNAVSRLLQYKLTNLFDVSIVGFTSESKLHESIEFYDPDTIVSVVDVNLQSRQEIPVIKISALLSEKDLKILDKYLIKNGNFDSNLITNTLSNELIRYTHETMFALDVEVENHEELIRFSGMLLEAGGCVDMHYTQEMLDVTKRFSSLSHILIAPRIILPHAGISEHVSKIGFSFIRLKTPIYVKDNEIKFAIGMCTTDRVNHREAVMELGRVLTDVEFLNQLDRIKSYYDFKNLVIDTLRKDG